MACNLLFARVRAASAAGRDDGRAPDVAGAGGKPARSAIPGSVGVRSPAFSRRCPLSRLEARCAAEQILQIIVLPADAGAEEQRALLERIVVAADHVEVRMELPLGGEPQVRLLVERAAEIEGLERQPDRPAQLGV